MIWTRLPVALYVPNLLCYARILAAFLGLYYSTNRPILALWIWIASGSLDLIDGILARKLNQCSNLGIVLDIVADIVLRTCCWLATLMVPSVQHSSLPQFSLLVCLIISIEWFTMLCTQLHAAQNKNHWKTQREKDPWLIREVFSGNFKSPLGILTIYGLFSANLWTWGCGQPELLESIPFFYFWMYTAYVGRLLALCVELWLCYTFISFVIAQDTEAVDQPKADKRAE